MTATAPAEQADRYARWVHRTKLADTSANIYAARVAAFVKWVEDHGAEFEDALTTPDGRDYAVRNWRRHLVGQNRAAATISQHISALKSFYDWLELGAPQHAGIEVPPSDRMGLVEADLRRVMREAEKRGPRDLALVSLLVNAGPRVDETHHLNKDDALMTARTGELMIRHGKGGKMRKVPLNSQAREHLQRWFEVRPNTGDPAMFLSRAGGRLSKRSMQESVQLAGAAAGVKIGPHTLRHTCGRRHAEAGTDVETLRTLLGHDHVQTTAGYMKARFADTMEAAEKIGVEF